LYYRKTSIKTYGNAVIKRIHRFIFSQLATTVNTVQLLSYLNKNTTIRINFLTCTCGSSF